MKLNLLALKDKIEFYPHEIQSHILKNMRRFTIVCSAKRLGKSKLAAYLALRELLMPRHVVWIIGPNYDLASRVWDYVEEWINLYFDGNQGPFRVNKHDRIIENTVTGAKMWMKTTEEPAGLLGKGLDLAIIDEAARIKDGIWDGYIRPNLMDRNGRAVLISNPFGFNWFYKEYLKGLPEGQADNPEYISFQFPTAIENESREVIGTNNPYAVSVDELKSIQKSTPRDRWIVEYLGNFQEGAGQLFKNFEPCIDDGIIIESSNEWFEPPKTGHLYSIGMDIAKVEDFTVICVVDRMTHRLVGFWRINNVSWLIMREKIRELSAKYYDAEITLDATGNAGDMFTENLSEIGVNVDTEFKYTNRTKMMLIDKLSLLMERKQVRFPRISNLISELRSFTYHMTGSGSMKYGSSSKDDCVNALALACWNLNDVPLEDNIIGNVYGMKSRNYR